MDFKLGLLILTFVSSMFINFDKLDGLRIGFVFALSYYLNRQKFTFQHWLFTHILFICIFVYACMNIYNKKFIGILGKGLHFSDEISKLGGENVITNSSSTQAYFFMGLFMLTIINLYIYFLSKSFKNRVKNKLGKFGDKGERGLRGKSGKDSNCAGGCGDDMCYFKLLSNISEVYNDYCRKQNPPLELLPDKKYIKNIFIKKKCRQMCNSKAFKTYMGNKGAGKTYEYIFGIWREWINIILKYEKGKEFLDSESKTDNDFDYMITEKDKIKADSFETSQPGTPSEGRESPFDELKKYDIWYWGTPLTSRPKNIIDCTVNNKSVKDSRLKRLKSNYYSPMWRSSIARQSLTSVGTRNGWSCPRKLQYVPRKQKGSSKVTVYRSDEFNTHNKLKYRKYKPLGDMIVDGDMPCHSREVNDSVPLVEDPKNTLNKHKYIKNQGHPMSAIDIVTGDVKKPLRYDLISYTKRNRGFNKEKGYSFWRPKCPRGYRALGDVMSVSNNLNQPSKSLINCIPEECTRKVNKSNIKQIWNGKTPNNTTLDPVLSSCGENNEYNGRLGATRNIDTDFTNFNFRKNKGDSKELNIYKNSNTNLFKINDDENHYEIIPKTSPDSCLDIDLLDTKYLKNDWIIGEKLPIDYSILNIYNE